MPDPGYVVGSTKYTRGRGSFRPGLKLCYKGGKAFARDFGITPLVRALAKLYPSWYLLRLKRILKNAMAMFCRQETLRQRRRYSLCTTTAAFLWGQGEAAMPS